MKKNEKERQTKLLESQAFTLAVMQGLRESASIGSDMAEMAGNAHAYAAECISQVVEKYPCLGKVVDECLRKIVKVKGYENGES